MIRFRWGELTGRFEDDEVLMDQQNQSAEILRRVLESAIDDAMTRSSGGDYLPGRINACHQVLTEWGAVIEEYRPPEAPEGATD